jgi:translation elongation factor aEF-1 beta
MSNVLTILQVIPTSPDADRDELLSVIQNELLKDLALEILKKEEEPLFFGLVALKLFVKTEDSDEGNEVLESFQKKLMDLDEIDNCEVELQTIIDY